MYGEDPVLVCPRICHHKRERRRRWLGKRERERERREREIDDDHLQKMGSLPEMRLLGTNNEEAVAYVRDILNKADPDFLVCLQNVSVCC